MQGTVNVYATAAHIRDTDTCTDDEHDTAMVIITAQAQLDETRWETQIPDEAKSWTIFESLPEAFFRSRKEDMSG